MQLNLELDGDTDLFTDEIFEFVMRKIILDNAETFFPEDEDSRPSKRAKYCDYRAEDYKLTGWGQLLEHPLLLDPESRQYKMFRQRFRLPPPLFFRLVKKCKELNVFDYIYETVKIPLEIKVLICLRILARDHCLDDMEELSSVPKSSVHRIFERFIDGCCAKLFPLFVKAPTGERLSKIMQTYDDLGFPGCVGSVDCTHIRWDRCPQRLQVLMKGRKDTPTVSFEVVVDHRAFHMSLKFVLKCRV